MSGAQARAAGGGWRWWRVAPWIGAGALLLAPLIAMQFTDEVQWDGFDFAVMGVMLAVPLVIFELAVRTSDSLAYRAGVALTLIGAFLMTWINLAVGIIGSEDNPANLMFFAILLLGLGGAFGGGFRAAGMARALLMMAAAQILAGTLAVTAGWGAHGANWPQAIIVLSGFFACVWLGAAWLFRRAASAG